MSRGDIVGLMREFKALTAKKKSGDTLTPTEKARRKELKAFLRTALKKPDAPSAAAPKATPIPISAEGRPIVENTINAPNPLTSDASVERVFPDEDPGPAVPPSPAEVARQLNSNAAAYGGSATAVGEDEYYPQDVDDSFKQPVAPKEALQANLDVIDPREVELIRLGLSIGAPPQPGDVGSKVPAGLMFLDDFHGLYEAGVLSQSDARAAAPRDTNVLIGEPCQATVQLNNGKSAKVQIASLTLNASSVSVTAGGKTQAVPLASIRAIYIPLGRGKKQRPRGDLHSVTLSDGTVVAGASDDISQQGAMFSIVPTESHDTMEKIIIPRTSVS